MVDSLFMCMPQENNRLILVHISLVGIYEVTRSLSTPYTFFFFF